MDGYIEEPPVDGGTRLVIYKCSNREGSTFALSPATTRMLAGRFGAKLRVAPRIFVAHDTGARDLRYGSLVKPLVTLLTGLDDGELLPIEDVVFWDPVADRRLG
jgi:hypothetical protein